MSFKARLRHSNPCEPKALRATLPLLTALIVAALALAPAARAQSVGNARPGVAVYGTPRIINVGILRLGGPTMQNTVPAYPAAGGPPTAITDQLRGAYIFYILNQRPDVLPNVWTLKNPNAPARVDAAITARFPSVNTGYDQDASVTQNMAPYWEIDGDAISTTLGLSAYDLILITTNGTIALNLEQRRALRQFVDKGGTLWIDTAQGATLDPSLIFHAAFGASTAGTLSATSADDLGHPLATGYYTLSSNDLDSLGLFGFSGGRQIVSALSGGTPDPSLFHAVNTFATGGGTSNFGSIVAANYGNGHILITDRAISDAINDGVGQTTGGNVYVGTATNQGGVCGTDFLAAPTADLKFVVNVLAWASNASGPSGGERGTNAQPGASTGALQSDWTFPATGQTLTSPYSPIGTATYGDRVYVTSDDGYLRAFDINPGQSLAYGADLVTPTGDNYINPITAADPVTVVPYSQDYSKGYPYDEIWARPEKPGETVSAPVVAEIPIPQSGGAAVNTPEVLVETAEGVVYASNAVSGLTDGTYGGDNAKFTGIVPAPVYYRGRIYATQQDGYVVVSSPGTTTGQFKISVDTSAGVGVNFILSSPFVQSIPGSDMQSFNGEDVISYIYDAPPTPTSAPPPVSNIYALFLGSRDEHERYGSYNSPPAGAPQSTYGNVVQQLSGLAGLTVTGAPEDTDDTPAGENWLFDFPNPAPPSQNIAVPQVQSNPGTVVTNTIQNAAAPVDMYADYDLTINNTQPNMIRTTINTAIAGNNNPMTTAIQGLAVSSVSQGIAASLSNVTTAFNTANDLYVTVNETGGVGGATTGYIMAVKERSPTVSTGTSLIPWRFALVSGVTDAEGVTYNFAGYHFFGAPVSDGNGYVYALATNNTNTILMAFFANAVCGFIAPFTATSVTQTDELNNAETILNTQIENNTFKNFAPTSNTTVLQPNLTMPLPVTIMGASQNGQPTSEIVPVSTAQGAQPLLAWWVQLPVALGTGVTPPGVVPTSPLRKIGNTLYFGGQETSTGASGAASNYALFAVYADPMGIGLQPDPITRQINSSDYRLVQVTPSGVGPVSMPPSGTGKYVVTAASSYTPTGAATAVPGGIEGLGFVPTLVTDNHRLIEMDPSGNATWVVDSTREPIAQTTAAGSVAAKTVVPLNRPTSLTQFSTDDYLLADTGNNRVIHIGRIGDVLTEFPDKYGHVLMATTRVNGTVAAIPHALEITSFSDPAGILAPGAPQTLSQPSDVTFWTTYDIDPSVAGNAPPTKIVAHYLICDGGNNRIVEVDDTYSQDQAANYGGANSSTYDFARDQDYHQLAWVTKTLENGHKYQYAAAQALFDSTANNPLINGPVAIAGAVSNALVSAVSDLTGLPGLDTMTGLPTLDVLSAANQDSQGSAVLLFAYAPIGFTYAGTSGTGTTANPYAATTPHDGLPFVVVNSVLADNAPTLAQQPKQSNAVPSTPYLGYTLRGLRSIQIYNFVIGQPAVGNAAAIPTSFGMVIADDDGVFDGSYLSIPNNNSVAPGTNTPPMTFAGTALDAYTADYGWSFRDDTAEDDYTPLVTQYDALLDVKDNQPLTNPTGMSLASTDFQGTSFSPASALRLANSTFLIVNRGGSGNPNGVPQFPATGETGTDFGGNVFVVRAKPGAGGQRANGGTLGGVMFGKPANTSALDGPSFALKSN